MISPRLCRGLGGERNENAESSARGILAGMLSLKRLLAATMLIAAGVGMIAAVFQFTLPAWYGLPLWFLGGILIGTGLLTPFRRASLGAILGFLLQVVIWLLLALIIPLNR